MTARIIDPLLLATWAFDVVTSETYEGGVDWTSHPVESGLEITDHGVINPDRIVLSGIVTDAPFPTQGLPLPQRARAAYERLLDLKNSKALLVVVTGLRVMRDMVIESVDLERDSQTGESVRPKVALKEIRIVASVTVPIPPEILRADAADAASKASAGKQVGTEADGAVVEKTLAKSITDGLKGSGGVSIQGLLAGGV